jgi:hypothetical protein
MQTNNFRCFASLYTLAFTSTLFIGCGAQPGTNVNLANSGVNPSNSSVRAPNTNAVNSGSVSTVPVEAKEPASYQAAVTLKLEAIGGEQNVALPTLTANVARSGADRRMEFSMPAGGRVVFLDKAGKNYLILPEKKQYAELNRESLGFDVRRMLMPEHIVEQVKNIQGVQVVGEEKYNGRDAIKYRYTAVADTQTRAGQVATESFLIVDKANGVPLRSETVSQSQSGGNVQGYSGLRVVTEITEIKTDVAADLFAEPSGYQKIESEQVRSQVNMIFNSVAMLIGQLMKQGRPPASPAVTSPAR